VVFFHAYYETNVTVRGCTKLFDGHNPYLTIPVSR
jgi:hypothetical protein